MSDGNEKKRYIGDGVYVEDQGFHIVLTTEDGIKATNTIYLEDVVALGLVRFLREKGWIK